MASNNKPNFLDNNFSMGDKSMIEKIKKGDKEIGFINYEKNRYVSPRTESHKFRMFGNGFGVSVKLVDYLLEKNIEWIVIDFGRGRYYLARVLDFINKGETWNDNGDDQLILPLNKFNQESTTEVQKQLEL